MKFNLVPHYIMSTFHYYKLHTFTLSLLLQVYLTQSAVTRLEATVPIEAVEEGGVFSIHCQVWNIAEDMDVTIYRRVGGNPAERLSIAEGVSKDAPERVFLAVRQLIDGSKIFFLTFMDATRADQGEYFCKVQAIDNDEVTLPRESVTIDVMYFPDEKEPICSPNSGQMFVEAGKEVTLNCSSELGNPAVEVSWTRSGTDTNIPATKQHAGTDVTFAELRIRPTLADNRAVYICQISSTAFPTKTKTCHIALLVIGDDTGNDSDEKRDDIITHRPDNGVIATSHSITADDRRLLCKDVCDNKGVFYWVLATVISALIAIIFLIISIILLIRYHFASRLNSEEHYMPASRHPREDIYTELEGRMGDNLVFMKLPKPMAPEYEHNVHSIPGIQMQR